MGSALLQRKHLITNLRPVAQLLDPMSGDWVRPVGRRDRLVDVLIAAVLLACTTVTIPLSVFTPPTTPLWFNMSWAVLITVPLAWRRRFPSTVAVTVTTVFLIGQITVTPEPLVSQIAPFIALYSVGAWGGDRRRSFIVRAALVAAIIAWLVIVVVSAPVRLPQQIGNLSASAALGLAALSSAMYLAAAMAFGETAWRSARRRAVLEVRTIELEAEREHTARQAVTLERMRIARELHDVVAHHVSMISIQAGAARRVLATAPETVGEALVVIEQNARQAVDELHSTLITMRSSDTPASPGEAPSTLGVEQIPELITEAQLAGNPAVLTVTGTVRSVPPIVALTLYRVTQEALTNVRKHAGQGASVNVRLRYTADVVELEIGDSGGTKGDEDSSRAGMGQLGMRERVTALNGSFEAGRGEPGYLVRIAVPVRSS